MSYLKIFFGIFLALSVTRFIPHPPNFTSLIALSFYAPAIFGIRFIPVVILSFALTDLIIGFHSTIIFSWGSVLLIGYLTTYFSSSITKRLSGALLGAIIFFIVTNLGVWIISGHYERSLAGLITCYVLAIPFFYNTLLATIFFSIIIESYLKLRKKNFISFLVLKYKFFKN
jgi:hypothetical protein